MPIGCGLLVALAIVGPASAQSYSRTDVITYHDNSSLWVIGQEASRTCAASIPQSAACDGGSDSVESQTVFDATWAVPTQKKAFGATKETLAYDTASAVSTGQRGTLKSVSDGKGNTTTLTSWKRGVPQLITYPATPDQPTPVTKSAAVNDDGTIASVTDEGGNKTCYAYDAMGRLSQITYPSETQPGVCDTSAWAPTTITFSGGHPAAYGVPAGHWRQTTLTGNGRKVLVLDALWRPVVEQALDLGNVSATLSEVIKRYDSNGRLVFQSYPMNTGGQALYTDTALKGTRTAYDAIGRVIRAEQDSEHGVLATTTVYLSDSNGPYTLVTNPRQQQTRTRYQMFDQPGYDRPVRIDAPEGTRTTIVRDVFGKPTSLTRGASQ